MVPADVAGEILTTSQERGGAAAQVMMGMEPSYLSATPFFSNSQIVLMNQRQVQLKKHDVPG